MTQRSPRTVTREGCYYRVAAPAWTDPADTRYANHRGGRWNPPAEFGALYLNATIQVAAANARAQHAGRAIKLFDLKPDARPDLVLFQIPSTKVLDVCTDSGIADLGFAPNFPYGVPWPPCQAIGRFARSKGLPGVASRSNAEATARSFSGEELALFDPVPVKESTARKPFHEWYPDPIPGSRTPEAAAKRD